MNWPPHKVKKSNLAYAANTPFITALYAVNNLRMWKDWLIISA